MGGSSAIALFVEKQPCIIYMRSLLILISLMLAPSSAFVVAPAARAVAPVATPAAVRCQAAPKMFIG